MSRAKDVDLAAVSGILLQEGSAQRQVQKTSGKDVISVMCQGLGSRGCVGRPVARRI